jgi:hypothetical protein
MTSNLENATIRRLVIAAFVFGAVGTGAELILLEHTDDIWQWTPVILLGVSLPFAGTLWFTSAKWLIRSFQGIMVLFVANGALGLYQHYQGNVEFELEMYPSVSGFELVWEALKGATPSLAPGTMMLLGMLGLICTFRHPTVTDARTLQTPRMQHHD